ncbi:hypothetical protein GPALN_011043 [Globodera pallida]|nr:hypothetical protein GPALN_011043 [Globodera pallida]
MMKSEWDPLKTKSDIKQRLNRLFGRFDQYSEFAVKPRAPDDTLAERVTATTTSASADPAKEKGQTLREREEGDGAVCQQQNDDTAESRDLEDLIGQLVNVSKPLSPVRFASEKPTTSSVELSVDTQLAEQPECSTRLSSDLDVLLQHITFVEPLISPIRSDSSFPSEDTSKRKKRPLCSPRFDDVPKRLALEADGHKSAEDPIPLTREQPATAKSHKFKLLLTKQSFLRLLEQQVHDKKLDPKVNLDVNTPSEVTGSVNSPLAMSNLVEKSVPDGHLKSSNNAGMSSFALRLEDGKNSVDHFANRARELKKSGNNEMDRGRQILFYFESIAFYIMTASTLSSKPEKVHSSLTDVVNFLNSSWTMFKNSKTVNTSSAASYVRSRLKTVQLMISSCLAFHLYSIHSVRVMSTHLILQRYEKENPKRPATSTAIEGANGNSVGTTTSSPAASTPNSNRSINSQQSLISLPTDIYASMSQQLRTLNHLMWSHKLWSDAKATSGFDNRAFNDGLSTLCGQLKHDAELAEVAEFLLAVTGWLWKEYARLQSDAKV